MRNKEDMECFKWHKNDRTCWVCDHEEECIIELAVHDFVDKLYFMCPHKDVFGYYSKCDRYDRKGLNCSHLDASIVYDCHSKEIKMFKRKLKLEKIEKNK